MNIGLLSNDLWINTAGWILSRRLGLSWTASKTQTDKEFLRRWLQFAA